MKKYKLKLKYIPYNDYIIFSNEHYIVKRRYLGFFWKAKAYFRYGDYYENKSLEQAKQEALNYMNNYCENLKEEKLAKKLLKQAYKDQREWEKNETVYKTCECGK